MLDLVFDPLEALNGHRIEILGSFSHGYNFTLFDPSYILDYRNQGNWGISFV